MRVNVNFDIDIDPDSWSEDYGPDPGEVRDDVQRHLRNIAVEHVDSLGHLR